MGMELNQPLQDTPLHMQQLERIEKQWRTVLADYPGTVYASRAQENLERLAALRIEIEKNQQANAE